MAFASQLKEAEERAREVSVVQILKYFGKLYLIFNQFFTCLFPKCWYDCSIEWKLLEYIHERNQSYAIYDMTSWIKQSVRYLMVSHRQLGSHAQSLGLDLTLEHLQIEHRTLNKYSNIQQYIYASKRLSFPTQWMQWLQDPSFVFQWTLSTDVDAVMVSKAK